MADTLPAWMNSALKILSSIVPIMGRLNRVTIWKRWNQSAQKRLNSVLDSFESILRRQITVESTTFSIRHGCIPRATTWPTKYRRHWSCRWMIWEAMHSYRAFEQYNRKMVEFHDWQPNSVYRRNGYVCVFSFLFSCFFYGQQIKVFNVFFFLRTIDSKYLRSSWPRTSKRLPWWCRYSATFQKRPTENVWFESGHCGVGCN